MQILVTEGNRKYTAFAVSSSGFQKSRKMSFGLSNAPKTFSRFIDTFFGPEFKHYVFGYLDDILLICETFANNCIHLKKY